MGPGVCVQERFPHTEVRSIAMLMVCCARVIVAVVGPWIVLKKVYGE